MTSRLAKIINLLDKGVSQTIIIFFAVVLFLCLYAIYDAICIRNEMRVVSEASSMVESVPDDERIETLKKTNDEIVAWVKIDNTDIDYPVMKANNNQYYLSHNFKKEYSTGGGIFADYRSDLLKDDYAVIYGHNMNGDSMFGEINKFEDGDFFASHEDGTLYLEKGEVHNFKVLGYAVVGNDNELVYDLDRVANDVNEEVAKYLNEHALNKNNILGEYNALVMLSTCYKHSSQRAVLLLGYNR